jgi:hypothetical protein
MKLKYLGELAGIVVGIDEDKNISYETMVMLTDRAWYLIKAMKLSGMDVGSLQENFAGILLMCDDRVTDQDTLSISLSGQVAGNNLNSSEKYSLGGSYGVRAFPQGEASGDAGSMLNIELTHNFMPKLQGLLFYDYGHIKVNHNSFDTADNARTIAGAGIGVNASLHGLRLNSYLAWRTQGVPLSEPASAERTPRLWVQVSGEF